MAKRQTVDEQFSRLAALRRCATIGDAERDELAALVESRTALIAAKAADVIAERGARVPVDALSRAFDRFLAERDQGCEAKTAIVKALVSADASASDVYLRAARHVQREPVLGGSVDVAADSAAWPGSV